MLDIEEFAPVDVSGCEDRYLISSHGRVVRTYKTMSSFLKIAIGTNGRPVIGIFNGKIKKLKLVHRLVAIAFVPNPENKPEVNHKDGNKFNNHKNNLEWVTRKENITHAFKNNLMHSLAGNDHPRAALTDIQVLEIRDKYIKNTYGSKKLSAEYGTSYNNILRIIHRKIWTHI